MRYIQRFDSASTEQAAIDAGQLGKPYIAFIEDGQYIDWNTKGIDYASMPLTIEVLSGGTAYIQGTSNTATKYIYQINNDEPVSGFTNNQLQIPLITGDVLKLWGYLNTQHSGIAFTGGDGNLYYNIYGNPSSLTEGGSSFGLDMRGNNVIDARNLVLNKSGFSCYHLFSGCTDLLYAPETVISHDCREMFAGCVSLVTVPELPTLELRGSQYDKMFYRCRSITTAPVLLADTVPQAAYRQMFEGCTNLNYVKCLAINRAELCTASWLRNISPTGTFVKHPNAVWSSGESGIPSGWTVIDADI